MAVRAVATGQTPDIPSAAHVARALQAAADTAARAGMVELARELRRVTAEIESHGSVPQSLCALSDREIQVLRLLTAGCTNAKIGEALFISRRTVAAHVSNILRKLECENRGQAAATAYAAGMV